MGLWQSSLQTQTKVKQHVPQSHSSQLQAPDRSQATSLALRCPHDKGSC